MYKATARPTLAVTSRPTLKQSLLCIGILGVLFAGAAHAADPTPPSDDRQSLSAAIGHAFETADADTDTVVNASLPARAFALHRPIIGERRSALAPAAAAGTSEPYVERGRTGDAASWRTKEFTNNWGLAAIQAEYAYARGITGQGVRIGILDSGVGLSHHEFSGKDHHGLVMADLRKDGSRCAVGAPLVGPDSCFATDGGRPSIDTHYIHPEMDILTSPDQKHLLGKIRMAFQPHGTHVAGIMAANRNGDTGIHGVAFNSTFDSASLFSDTYTILDGLCALGVVCRTAFQTPSASAHDHMFAQMAANNVRAINHSWGLANEPETAKGQDEIFNHPQMRPILASLRNGSVNHGVLQVWAAGNTRDEIASPELSPIAGSYASLPRLYPELEKYWLAVVNLDRTTTPDNPFVLSNVSMKCGLAMNWCVAAPGSMVPSTVYAGLSFDGRFDVDAQGNGRLADLDKLKPEFMYARMTGTSMAAPHVTGALALLFERYPYMDGTQVRDVLLTTARDLGAPGVDEIYGWGMVDLKKGMEGFGQIRVDTDIVMNQRAGGAKVWEGNAWDNWTNDIGGPGRLTKSGIGWLRLAGNNSFNGLTVRAGILELAGGANALRNDIRVDGGLFHLSKGGVSNGAALTVNGGVARIDGTIAGAATLVRRNGVLTGAGTLGDTRVEGTIAPGNAIGTLTVNGNYVQVAGSTFEAELRPPSESDLLRVSGTATLQGGTFKAIQMPGVFSLGQSYNVLSAANGVTGTFNTLDTSAISPFLKLTLGYQPRLVSVSVTRGATFASAAATANQRATAGAIDGLANANRLVQTLSLLQAAPARAAFDALSGEAHASLAAGIHGNSHMLRDAAVARARIGSDAFTAQADESGVALWAQATGQTSHFGASRNVARSVANDQAFLVGGDYRFDGGVRLGALFGTGEGEMDTALRSSSARLQNRYAGLYAGGQWGGFGVRGGIVRGDHLVRMTRSIAYPGLSTTNTSRYTVTADQLFVDVGYRFGSQGWDIEPFVQYANVRIATPDFTENGTVAESALRHRSSRSSIGTTTAGARFGMNLKGSAQEQTWLSLRGMLGYRNASGDTDGSMRLAFPASQPFTIHGNSVGRSAWVSEVGFAARTTRNSLLELNYSGQRVAASGGTPASRQHGVMARFSVQF